MKNLAAFEHLPDSARIWIYPINRSLTDTEIKEINVDLATFAQSWAAHGEQLYGAATVVNPFFLVFAVDESQVPPSGCSIDSSVRFIKTLGAKYDLDFFSRLTIYTFNSGRIEGVSFSQLGELAADTLIFDTLISSLGALRASWPIPLKESHLAAMLVK